uniref:protein-L-isoaspartate O-methyltransferase family protein n=1 Tax=Salmonella enterica TaxID=28901 RepID=UPI003D768DAB
DLITVAAAARRIPDALVDQLAPGGRMVIPVGQLSQELLLIERAENGQLSEHPIIPVRFVPLIEADPAAPRE